AGVTGSGVAAALIASVIFGVSHSVQGWKSAGVITVIALLLHGLVALSGTLLLAIAIHAIYDAVAGLAYGRMGEELGYPVDGVRVEAERWWLRGWARRCGGTAEIRVAERR